MFSRTSETAYKLPRKINIGNDFYKARKKIKGTIKIVFLLCTLTFISLI